MEPSGAERVLRRAGAAALLALIAAASAGGCNSVTGVDDLTFDAVDAGGAPACQLKAFASTLPTCGECIAANCCEKANACTDDPACATCIDGTCQTPEPDKYLLFGACALGNCAQCFVSKECTTKLACEKCCGNAHPEGESLFKQDLQDCKCDAQVCGKECACAQTDVVTPACLDCLTASCGKFSRTSTSREGQLYLSCRYGCPSQKM